MIRRFSVAALVLAACSSSPKPVPPAPGGATAYFTLGPSASLPTFFDFPWPTDLRLTPAGTPDFGGFVNPTGTSLLPGLEAIAEQRKGFPMVAAGYFRFNAAMAPENIGTVIPAAAVQSILLIDVDPSSASKDALFPVVASLEPKDAYLPDTTLAVAARPGFVMRPDNEYAYVVLRSLGDASGQPLGVPSLLWSLEHNVTPSGDEAVAANYAPLWPALQAIGVQADQVAVAAVFTTGDVVSDLNALSSALVQRDPVALGPIGFPPDGGAVHEGYCELDGTMTLPKYQVGEPPFNTGGTFDAGPDGLPTVQGIYNDVPFVLTFPTGTMPAGGYPLVIYFHGSGGIARAVIDRGTAYEIEDGGWLYTLGEGPAWVLAPYGFAAAGAALPLSPDRQDGGSAFYLDDLCASCDDPEDTAYLNFSNLAAFRDTFRQGVIESRMFLNVLSSLSIPLSAAELQTCGITLPPGETALHYDPVHLMAQGQSMGGMYTNLVSAVEPRVQACVPTGAGGFWSYFVLNSPQVPAAIVPDLLELEPRHGLAASDAHAAGNRVGARRSDGVHHPPGASPAPGRASAADLRAGGHRRLLLFHADLRRDGPRLRSARGGRHDLGHDATGAGARRALGVRAVSGDQRLHVGVGTALHGCGGPVRRPDRIRRALPLHPSARSEAPVCVLPFHLPSDRQRGGGFRPRRWPRRTLSLGPY